MQPNQLFHQFLQGFVNPRTRRAYESDLMDFFGGHPTEGQLLDFLNSPPASWLERMESYFHFQLQRRRVSASTLHRRLSLLVRFVAFAHEQGVGAIDPHWAKQVTQEMELGGGIKNANCSISNHLQSTFASTTAEAIAATGAIAAVRKRSSSAQSKADESSAHQMQAVAQAWPKLLDLVPKGTVRGARDRVILLLLGRIGLERAQVCELRVDDFDRVQGTLRIPIKHRLSPKRQDGIRKSETSAWNVLKDASLTSDATHLTTNIALDSDVALALEAYLTLSGHRKTGVEPLVVSLNASLVAMNAALTVDGIYKIVQGYGKQVGLPWLNSRHLKSEALRAALTGRTVAEAFACLPHISLPVWQRHAPRLSVVAGIDIGSTK